MKLLTQVLARQLLSRRQGVKAIMQLTDRDSKILSYLFTQGVATAEQLTARFFDSSESFRQRISTLTQAGIVEAVRVVDFRHSVPSKFIPLFQMMKVAPAARSKFKVYRLGELIRSQYPKSDIFADPIYWQHQLGVNEILRIMEPFLKNRYPEGAFITDIQTRWENKEFMGEETPIPDLVWKYKRVRFAFEFERTLKKERYYLLRFYKLENSLFKKVIYIVEDEKIFKRLAKLAFSFPKIGFMMFSTNTVFNSLKGNRSITEFLEIEDEVKENLPPKELNLNF